MLELSILTLKKRGGGLENLRKIVENKQMYVFYYSLLVIVFVVVVIVFE